MRKEVAVWSILSLLTIIALGILLVEEGYDIPRIDKTLITGRGLSGTLALIIEDTIRNINILSPTNTTYSESYSPTGYYDVSLNVSSNFNPTSWAFTLHDLRHNTIINDTVSFTPNITLQAVRWGNNLTVYAKRTGESWYSKSVTFTVSVPNQAPILGDIDSQIYLCEGDVAAYEFNATDVDEDSLSFDISPTNPFYVKQTSTSGYIVKIAQIQSASSGFTKAQAGGINGGHLNYSEVISVDDGTNADSASTNITVIEINNAPSLDNGVSTGLGVQTVYTKGSGSSFNYQYNSTDTEDGNSNDGILNFNLTWAGGENLFDINISTGVMNFTPTASQNGTYDLTICINDTGIDNPHQNISDVCGQTGASITVCDDFSLTVTNSNRAPTITSYTPSILNFSVAGTTSTTFSIVESDADGTYPDARWYVDGVWKETDTGSLTDSYSYSFGCGVSGEHVVNVTITDGLANASVQWNLTVTNVDCPAGGGSSGGGGGGGGSLANLFCNENWACDSWRVCQNAERTFRSKALSPEDYISIKEQCAQNGLDERFCGYQTTSCLDLNLCENQKYRVPKPAERQVCYFTENPSCNDGITNCHSGGCEVLVDCGGPCGPCPTCSDSIQNQGEEGVDCGGPCPYICESESPLFGGTFFVVGLSVAALILAIFIIFKILHLLGVGKRKKKKQGKI